MASAGESISRLLGLLYEASASRRPWADFLMELAKVTRSDAAYFLLFDMEGEARLDLSFGLELAWKQAHAARFKEHDVVMKAFLNAKADHAQLIGAGKPVDSQALEPPAHLYNDSKIASGLRRLCTAVLGNLEGMHEGGLGILRKGGRLPYGREHLLLISRLAPHVSRALNINRTLTQDQQRARSMRQLLEATDATVVSLDRQGRVVRMTPAAERLLAQRQGIGIENGHIYVARTAENTKLHELIAVAARAGIDVGLERQEPHFADTTPEPRGGLVWSATHGGAMVIARPAPHRPLAAVVTPFVPESTLALDQPVALIFFSDPEAHLSSRRSVLGMLYGLTPTECRVAELLAGGYELAAASERLNMSVETARFHLKKIYRKTGINRQPELVRLILGLPCF